MESFPEGPDDAANFDMELIGYDAVERELVECFDVLGGIADERCQALVTEIARLVRSPEEIEGLVFCHELGRVVTELLGNPVFATDIKYYQALDFIMNHAIDDGASWNVSGPSVESSVSEERVSIERISQTTITGAKFRGATLKSPEFDMGGRHVILSGWIEPALIFEVDFQNSERSEQRVLPLSKISGLYQSTLPRDGRRPGANDTSYLRQSIPVRDFISGGMESLLKSDISISSLLARHGGKVSLDRRFHIRFQLSIIAKV